MLGVSVGVFLGALEVLGGVVVEIVAVVGTAQPSTRVFATMWPWCLDALWTTWHCIVC